ncbi:MAG: response regulator [bacterium]|nr:response regulator [bacterium]
MSLHNIAESFVTELRPGVEPGRVLIAEDTELLLERIAQFLCFEGHSVQTAISGGEALECVENCPPDIILCDVLMPGIDGYEFSRRVKSDPATAHIPIIMISARGQREEVVRGLEFAEEYVTKPVDLRELKARVDSMLRLKRAQDAVRAANQKLEDTVRRRTVRLRLSNRRLAREVRRREETESAVRTLTRRIITVREDERGALAMDMHDDVGQCLLAAKLDLQATFARLAQDVDVTTEADRILKRVDTIASRIRQISHSLSPIGLRNLGLQDAIQNMVEMFMESHPVVKIETRLAHLDDYFPGAWDVNLYRIVQESLANALKHARATRIIVSDELLAAGAGLRVCIRDDGCGFEFGQGDGIGLFVMKERAQLSGGVCTIYSRKSSASETDEVSGTEVQIDFNPG